MVLLDRDFRVLDVNPAALRLDGRPHEALIGVTHWQAWPGSETTELGEMLRAVMAQRVPGEVSTRFTAARGNKVGLEARVFPHPGGIAVFFRDVSERKAMEDALRSSEARFVAIVETIDQMVWSTRPDGFHDFYNQRWYEYTGLPVGSTDGDAWIGLFRPDDQPRTWERWQQSLATGEPYHIEYRLKHRDAGFRWVIDRAQCVRGPDGAIIRWFGTCTDIDDIVVARDVLARSRVELEALVAERTAELEASQEALRQSHKMEAIGQLTGCIAHDFNNMLSIVIGSLDLARRRMPELPQVRRLLDNATEGANRAAELTARLLAFSRQQPLQPAVIDANRLVAAMSELSRRTLDEQIHIETVLAGGRWPTRADGAHWRTPSSACASTPATRASRRPVDHRNLQRVARRCLCPRSPRRAGRAVCPSFGDRYRYRHVERRCRAGARVLYKTNAVGKGPGSANSMAMSNNRAAM